MSRQASTALVEKKQEGLLEQRPVTSIDELINYDQQRELDRQNNQHLTKQAMHKKESVVTTRKSSLRGAAGAAGNQQPEPVARGLSANSGFGIGGLGSFTNAGGPGSQPQQQLTNSGAILRM